MVVIKIQCGCGQKYAFDVEPVDGRMGYAVQCPVCGVEGTMIANRLLGQNLTAQASSGSGLRIGNRNPPTQSPAPPSRSPCEAVRAGGPSRSKVWNTRRLRALGGGVILILAGTVLYARVQNSARKPADHDPVVQDGLPHTLDELNAWYLEPPPGQNAALFYVEGFAALQWGGATIAKIPFLGQEKPPLPGIPLSASVKSAMSTLIHSNRDALQCFTKGLQ